MLAFSSNCSPQKASFKVCELSSRIVNKHTKVRVSVIGLRPSRYNSGKYHKYRHNSNLMRWVHQHQHDRPHAVWTLLEKQVHSICAKPKCSASWVSLEYTIIPIPHTPGTWFMEATYNRFCQCCLAEVSLKELWRLLDGQKVAEDKEGAGGI